jgi:hypothetical protein
VSWKELVAATKEEPAYYHPTHAAAAARMDLEMRCVREGVQFQQGHHAKRCYYLRLGFVVGASDGEETEYVYAEHARSGEVHGRPITARELRRRGAQL